ncbi:acetyl-CoA carboxylase biotin carboxyl carrier protein [Vandammella animalimorsus]|uniref:Biotin carboxyl carrier protein of acetyl-CoA carboxylase n=1 Tax=Vandammella animalimorsus TaxID=2029117 RepID=A0A2A2AA67_9BURK|nr:acetyl-CoA carboxylase biotin carboxyl carrier protein [Vandammella animalimorsus]PAT34736.1 acetyl-CoA carboxylase, biotin carboxyl carrier protein [Vandammella animalimorsus]PAT43548.1 acetyl-CoA carboxylase, biotin carboxyl carrier protein [Vandammella animalimorsus]RRD67797.1 acetyl-CoA carboxylase biotin carboxyl carrier protein [Comamonadaceae bacterium OH2310_COT-174]
MDLRKLKTLIDLVSESNVTELEITEAEGKVRIVKGGAPVLVPAPVAAAPALTAIAPAASAPQQEAAPPATAAAPAAAGASITAPMVGTFYRAPNPSADAFVEVGTQVKEGQIVCIIEAMKILNEIEADRSGTIKQILVENGQAVEYGQPLFIIE